MDLHRQIMNIMADTNKAGTDDPRIAYLHGHRDARHAAAELALLTNAESEFEVWQGDEMQASASGPRETALNEAMHYAAQYAQDGPVRVFEVTRVLVRPNLEVSGAGTASA